MSSDDHFLAGFDLGNNGIIPVWKGTLDCQLKRLTGRNFGNIGVEWVLKMFNNLAAKQGV